MIPRPRTSTLFPYTTLFRSRRRTRASCCRARDERRIRALGRAPKAILVGADPRCRETLGRKQHRSEEHTSELQSHSDLVCRLLLEKKKKHKTEQIKTHAK